MSGQILPIEDYTLHTAGISAEPAPTGGKHFRLTIACALSIGIHLFILFQPVTGRSGLNGAGPRPRIQLTVLHHQQPASASTSQARADTGRASAARPAEPPAVAAETPAAGSPTPPISPVTDAAVDFGVMPYLPAGLLDVKPMVVVDLPADPDNLREYDISGEMIVTLWISGSGTIDAVSPEYSNLPQGFQERALKHFYTMRFTPGKIGDKSVPTALRIQVNFSQRSNANSGKSAQ